MDGEPKPKTFAITVMNNKSFSADEVLGRAIIPFTESVDNWFPLEGDGAQGELRVVLRFYNGDVLFPFVSGVWCVVCCVWCVLCCAITDLPRRRRARPWPRCRETTWGTLKSCAPSGRRP
jgi:hypothetical protein